MSQEEAAERSGIPIGSLRKYEQGPSKPGYEAIYKLAAIGINANWLLTGEGDALLDQGAQSAPVQLQASHMQYRVEESAPQPEAPAGVDSAFMRLCLGACMMVHGEPFAREPATLQVEYACELYNHLTKQAATRPEGIKSALAAISRLETRGVADQLRLLLQLGWARAYNNGAPPKNDPPDTTVP